MAHSAAEEGKEAGGSAVVKRELAEEEEEEEEAGALEPERRGFARSPKDHYCNQVALINAVVKPPWVRCFGNLGTGFVGVRPDTKERSVKVEDGTGPSGTDAAAATMFGASLVSGRSNDGAVPPDATIVIFISAPAAPLQSRGGKTIDGYKDALDRSGQTLEWSAQRSDKNSKRIEAIIGHCHSGGRVVVAVRSPTSKRFTLLGTVSHIDNLVKARFLIEHGDHIIQEKGTRTFHKMITVACLNVGLRSGVGLSGARYPLIKGTAKWCSACCYAPPKAVLHFGELLADGVTAFHSPIQRGVKREPRELREQRERVMKAKMEVDSMAVPVKRLRCKQSLTKEDKPHVDSPPQAQVKSEVLDKLKDLECHDAPPSGAVKQEPHDDSSEDAFGYSSVVAS